MHTLGNSPLAAQMDRRIDNVYHEDLAFLKRHQAINPVFSKGVCVASAALLIVIGASEAKPYPITNARQSLPRYNLHSVVASHLGLDHRCDSEVREYGLCPYRVGVAGAFVAQSGYGPNSMDAPPVQPGVVPGPMGLPGQQPVDGPNPLDAPPAQPGSMTGPMGLPPQQPTSSPAPTGFPSAPSGYGQSPMGPSLGQASPHPPSTATPPTQPGFGPRATPSLDTRAGNGNAGLRATNTARMRAESLNGGLRVYRTASCMHQQSGGECLIRKDSGGYLFRFLGGEPGWQQLRRAPSLETEILIGPDGKTVLEVLYNGPPRSLSSPDLQPAAPYPYPSTPTP